MHLLAPASSTWSSLVVGVAQEYSIRAAFLAAGGPAGIPVTVVVTVPSGFVLAGGASFALRTGTGWPANSTILLINHGYIEGYGGAGGGVDGGTAVYVETNGVSIDNTDGYIFGGGGGGATGPTVMSGYYGGGGGGGGQGNPGGARGSPPSAVYPGEYGTVGTRDARGLGGAGMQIPFGIWGADGGDGGQWGLSGTPSGLNSDGQQNTNYGDAGYAVRLNGRTVTWIGITPTTGLNYSAHYKGIVG